MVVHFLYLGLKIRCNINDSGEVQPLWIGGKVLQVKPAANDNFILLTQQAAKGQK